MSLSSARLRYLSAIGAMLPSAALVACKEPAANVSVDATSVTTPATASAVASATPTDTTPTDPAADAGRPFHMPSCPSGAFCVAENANVDAKTAAPAPYGHCSATTKRPGDTPDAQIGPNASVTFSAANTAAERVKDAKACCYTWVILCPGGRAFRDATGTPTVARTTERIDWTGAVGAIATDSLTAEERAAHAEHWTREAAFEHASIASFAQLTLDLLSVGAPPDLLEATQRATLDEIEHAKITFSLATAYGGRAVGPASLVASPGASRTLAALAKSTFIDACVGESVASASLADSARAATDPVLRAALAQMASDEERHAELAWRIVAWTLRSGDAEVVTVLADAMDEVIAELVSLTRDVASPTPAGELRGAVLREVVLPCTVALLTSKDHLIDGRQTVSMQASLASH